MKTAKIVGLVCVGGLLAAGAVMAMDNGHKEGKGNKNNSGGAIVVNARTKPVTDARTAPAPKEPWLNVNVAISDNERHAVRTYVDQCNASPERGPKGKRLPPGLAKKVARGEKLPPGWQKKCVPGQVMPAEVYERCHPLPPELVVKLPPPPPDTITVTIGGKVVRLVKATLEILDVFDVHVRI